MTATKPGDVLAIICGSDPCPLKRLVDRRVVVRVTRDVIIDDRGASWRRADGGETGPPHDMPTYKAVPWVEDHERRWAIKETRREYEGMLGEMRRWIGDRFDKPDKVIAAAGDKIRAAYEAAKAAWEAG